MIYISPYEYVKNWNIHLFYSLQVRNLFCVPLVGSILEILQLWGNTRSICTILNALSVVKLVERHFTTWDTSRCTCVVTQERNHIHVISVEKLLHILIAWRSTLVYMQTIVNSYAMYVETDLGAWKSIQKVTHKRSCGRNSNGSNVLMVKQLDLGNVIQLLNQWKNWYL